MTDFFGISTNTIYSGGDSMEEGKAILTDLPTSVRGFVYEGEDGEPMIVVNSRLTREANQLTYMHERDHVTRGDMENQTYTEYQ